MLVQLEYEPSTGSLKDPTNNAVVACYCGLEYLEVKKDAVHELVKLKDAGFTANEIMQMRREELI